MRLAGTGAAAGKIINSPGLFFVQNTGIFSRFELAFSINRDYNIL